MDFDCGFLFEHKYRIDIFSISNKNTHFLCYVAHIKEENSFDLFFKVDVPKKVGNKVNFSYFQLY